MTIRENILLQFAESATNSICNWGLWQVKRVIISENLLIVLLSVLTAWVIAAFLYQNVILDERLSELKSILYLSEQAKNPISGQLMTAINRSGPGKTIRVELVPAGKKVSCPEVLEARRSGYGENKVSYNILTDSMVGVAGKEKNGTVIHLFSTVQGGGYTLWSIIPALLIAAALSVGQASRLFNNIDFIFRGAVMTLERAGNEGGIKVNPAPEMLQYPDLLESAHELAQVSTRVSERVKDLFIENKRIDYLLNNMNEGLIVLDREMNIIVINSSAIRFFDSNENIKGQNILRLTHLPLIEDTLSNVTLNGEPSAIDIKSADGKKTLQLLMSAVNNEEQNIDGAIMIISDVTSIRLAEQIRSEFVANASHELKTPLTSIKGFSELIDSGIINDPNKAHGYLEHIREETERMIGLISDILKLSELEATSHDTGIVQVSLKRIAQKVCDSLVNQITTRGVTVAVSGEIGSMEANPDQMEQMLLNLTDNAIKYNKPGGRMDIIVEQESDSVSVTVRDTGVGIPKDAQQRVFERFYRVDKSRSRKLGGTGLGLSIVKHIVELYKGTIRLESEPGKGTSIKVTLPAANDCEENS